MGACTPGSGAGNSFPQRQSTCTTRGGAGFQGEETKAGPLGEGSELEKREEEQGCAEEAGESEHSTGAWVPAGSTSEGLPLCWGQEHHQPESKRDGMFSGEAATEGKRVGGRPSPCSKRTSWCTGLWDLSEGVRSGFCGPISPLPSSPHEAKLKIKCSERKTDRTPQLKCRHLLEHSLNTDILSVSAPSSALAPG